jgi:hypothetical protein
MLRVMCWDQNVNGVLLIYGQHNTTRFTIGYSDMFRLT